MLSCTTSADGDFSVSVAEHLEYKFEITAMGYAPYVDIVTVNTSDINLGTIALTESFSTVFNVVPASAVDSAVISWQMPDTEANDTIILDDDNGQGGMGWNEYTEGWTGNLFEMEGLHDCGNVVNSTKKNREKRNN